MIDSPSSRFDSCHRSNSVRPDTARQSVRYPGRMVRASAEPLRVDSPSTRAVVDRCPGRDLSGEPVTVTTTFESCAHRQRLRVASPASPRRPCSVSRGTVASSGGRANQVSSSRFDPRLDGRLDTPSPFTGPQTGRDTLGWGCKSVDGSYPTVGRPNDDADAMKTVGSLVRHPVPLATEQKRVRA
jgi:hypothetical protein